MRSQYRKEGSDADGQGFARTYDIDLGTAPQLRHTPIRLERSAETPNTVHVLPHLMPMQGHSIVFLVVKLVYITVPGCLTSHLLQAGINVIASLHDELQGSLHPAQGV